MININSLIVRAIFAYRSGRFVPVPSTPQPESGYSSAGIHNLAQQTLSSQDFISCQSIIEIISVAKNLLAQKLFDDAAETLKKAAISLNNNPLTKNLEISCLFLISHSEVELDFQTGNFESLMENLKKTAKHGVYLEQNHEYQSLHFTRLEQIHLWICALANAGKTEDAILLANETLEYINLNSENISTGEGWSRKQAEKIPAVLRDALSTQIASQAALIISMQAPEGATALFNKFTVWRIFEKHPGLNEIYLWGRAEKAYTGKDYREFLSIGTELLAEGRKETLLWDITVLNLCRCCKNLKPDQTRDFLIEVSENTEKMRHLPPGGYALPTPICYKKIFVTKEHSFPAFVLPEELRTMLIHLGGAAAVIFARKKESRRFHAYNVGLPRSGCSSIMALFSNYNSVAEYKERESVELITAWKDGMISRDTLHRYLLYRHEEGNLEMDPASFNHFYLDILLEEMPQAKFIFTIRDCYSWTNSFLKMISRWRKHFIDIDSAMPAWMEGYGRILFGKYDWMWFSSYDALKPHLDVLVERFVKCWAENNHRILTLLPPERSLIVSTSEISTSQQNMADYIGISVDTITEHHHINVSPDSENILENFDRARFNEILGNYMTPEIEKVLAVATL